jgi:hypothetical protein
MSIGPESIEAVVCEFRVANSMRDIFVAQILLYSPRIVTIVRELVTACMSQHMRMDGELDSGP